MASFVASQIACRPVCTAPQQNKAPRATGMVACAPLSAKFTLSNEVSLRSQSTKTAPKTSTHRQATVKPQAMARFETEKTYVMVKPDGVQRGLVGNIISRFETKGFHLKGLKLFQCPKELAETHYGDLSEKPFFPDLVDYIVSGPVVCMVWEGPGVVKSARKLIGATNPLESEPGTIRGDLAIEVGRNVVHGSDSVENGEKEIGLWFGDEGVIEWEQAMSPWLRE
ncbi:Nucleoside diphosphate kinase II, chloroplastic [Cymbomonas tetramitiformis]|uniref:Nucleoside diphosphate kinase n=1 Tax=Cymbomonas tetramitiformis TaxID=36881 RepID=A0AAE0F2L4_9CHLO|nr:Nucleoside diphosphate kinase II, chloroplastic [Cymbomonas tetramitiformis]